MKNERKTISREEAVERAEALLKQMTLREKAGQLNQHLYGFQAYEVQEEDVRPTKVFRKEVDHFGGIGVLYGLYRADPWSGRTYADGLYGKRCIRAYNRLQEYILNNTRLRIPMMVSSESPHGHQALDGYLLPVNLASGATFNPGLVADGFAVAARQQRRLGVDLCLLSLLDVCRDPRWGRSEECFSEDPLLSAVMASGIVRRVQQEGLAAVAKCLAAQGETTGGVNASAARIGERELREIHLPAMAACCQEGVQGVMAAYNEIDGVYCCANRKLLTGILREEMGFNGIVMADGMALDNLDRMTGDNVRSAATGLAAGVDLSLWDSAFTKLEEAVIAGYVPESCLDRSVRRILTMKFERGLFDSPYLDEEQDVRTYSVTDYPQSLDIARESVVLLKNDGGVLPLTQKAVALIGPGIGDIYAMLGDYTPPVREGQYETLLDGMRREAKKKGVRLLAADGSDTAKARCLAGECEVTVLALGGSSSRFGGAAFDANGAARTAKRTRMDCGEGVDLAELSLPEDQRELLDAVLLQARENGRKVVCLVTGGRPYCPGRAMEADALLYAFYPGPWGGRALAEILFGVVNPSGRLPVSIPVSPGQLPVCYNQKASYKRHYTDIPDEPAFTFGDGTGYSTFAFRDFRLSAESIQRPEDVLQLSLTVRNTSGRDGSAVLLLFFRCLQGVAVRRIKELGAFEKLSLKAGEERSVIITLPAECLMEWDESMKRVLTPAKVQLSLEESGRQIFRAQVMAGNSLERPEGK